MTKILYVSSAVQRVLMEEVLIPELLTGFWKNHRPAGHGEMWRDVDVQESTDGKLGPVGFVSPRTYNFLNPEFFIPNAHKLLGIAQTVKANVNEKALKKELTELCQIVSQRLAAKDASPLKVYRGNHKPGTVTVSTSKARQAALDLQRAAMAPLEQPKAGKKRTAVRRVEENVTVTTTSSGATVRRVAVQPAHASPNTEDD